MTREYDENRPVNRKLPPLTMAEQRASRLNPTERLRFLEAFQQARVATVRGDDRLYLWIRRGLDQDDSVRVAGLIEGAASGNDGKMVL